MANNGDEIINNLLGKDANIESVKRFMKSGEGSSLLRELAGKKNDTLKRVAEAGEKGKMEDAAKAVKELLSTPEGAKLAEALTKLFGKGGSTDGRA